jgi:CBS domain-containing protein
MATHIVTVDSTTPYKEILARLARHGVGSAPVVEVDGTCSVSSPKRTCSTSTTADAPGWAAGISELGVADSGERRTRQ